jgi:SnoaL-like domain
LGDKAVSQENVELVSRTIPSAELNFAELARNDAIYAAYLEEVRSLFHDDVVFVNHGFPAGQMTCVGLAGIRSLFRDWYKPWRTYRTEVERAVDCGERVLHLTRDITLHEARHTFAPMMITQPWRSHTTVTAISCRGPRPRRQACWTPTLRRPPSEPNDQLVFPLDQSAVARGRTRCHARWMGRTRSPLETAIIAWIAFKVISVLLGFGLTVETLSNRSHGGQINPEAGQAIGYASLALGVLILLLLLAEGKYLIAACLAGVAIAVPLLIQTYKPSITVRPPIPGQRGGSLLKPAIGDQRAGRSGGAAIPVVDLYAAVLANSAALPRGMIVVEGTPACERMTAAARAQLEQAVLHGRTGCPQALAVAGRRALFGRLYLSETDLLRRLSVAADAQSAVFLAGNAVHVELVAEASGWRISGFTGGAFAGR